MTADPVEHAYAPSEVAARLAATLPHWTAEDGCIRRTYRTAGWKATMMAANVIGHLAEAAWHHPDMALSYASVEVSLSTHTAKGITDKDFALARKIEDVLAWQPRREGGALEGTPRDDKAHAYLIYDD
jgi:4a-hydroxytetrahydrobiopterin dehydratase